VPLGPDPQRARDVLAQLSDLRDTVTASEDDVLACLVVTGEPRPQRVLDDWLDQVADTLRALGEAASDVSSGLARHGDAERVAPLDSPVAADDSRAARGSVEERR
jgi:hypothetical protein